MRWLLAKSGSSTTSSRPPWPSANTVGVPVSGADTSPVALILSGLIINLYCATLSTLLVLANHEVLNNLFIWQSGSLNQNSWQDVYHLAPRLAAVAVLAALLARPLEVLGLDDATAGSLGLSPGRMRLLALSVAVALSASTIASAVTALSPTKAKPGPISP